MTPDKDEFLASVRKRNQAERLARRPELRQIAQMEVLANELTGHPAWDTFLQQLTARKDDIAERIAGVENEFSTKLLTTDQLMWAKQQVTELRGRHSELADIMALPIRLIEQGKLARTELRDLGQDDEVAS